MSDSLGQIRLGKTGTKLPNEYFLKNEILNENHNSKSGNVVTLYSNIILKMAAATEISDEDAAVLQFPKGKKKYNFLPSLRF